MGIQGLRHSGNFTANERPENWRKGLLLRYPTGKAPLTALTSVMKSEATNDPVFHWWEKELQTRRFALSANLDAPAALTSDTVAVTSGGLTLKKGDVLRVEHTGEIMLVTQDPSSDTSITVIRGHSSTTPATVTVASQNPYVFVLGSAYEEGSNAPTGVNFDPVEVFNHTQIFRNTLEITRTASKTMLRTEDAVKEAKREVSELHSIDIERALWFGKYGSTTINGKPARLTKGVEQFIDSGNIVDQAGTALQMTVLEGWMERIFRFGSSEKMGFCGNRALLAINQCVRKNSDFNIQSGIKEYGMAVMRLTSPFGEIVLKTHPLFNQMTSVSGTYYSHDSWLFVLDMENLKYRYLTDSDTKYEPKLQDNGLDGMKSGFITECGLEVHHGKTHFLIKGLNTGAVDA